MTRSSRIVPALGLLVLLAATPALRAAPEEAGGSTYVNADLGVKAKAPGGWSLVADRGAAPVTWQRLATFNDTDTDAQAVLSVRPRKAATLDELLASVRKDWETGSDRLDVSSMRKVEATPLDDRARVIVEASFRRKPKPKEKGVPPPPGSGTLYQVQATYFLGPGYTYLLYAQGQDTHWSRLRRPLRELEKSVAFPGRQDEGPVGEGSYRNEVAGFACRFPEDYTVVVPARSSHLVQFVGVSKTDPVLSVYGFTWEGTVAQDAERLVAYYEQDLAGIAKVSTVEIDGLQGRKIVAHAVVAGEDQVVVLGIVKRGEDCFRLRVSAPAGQDVKAESAFRRFVAGFDLGRP